MCRQCVPCIYLHTHSFSYTSAQSLIHFVPFIFAIILKQILITKRHWLFFDESSLMELKCSGQCNFNFFARHNKLNNQVAVIDLKIRGWGLNCSMVRRKVPWSNKWMEDSYQLHAQAQTNRLVDSQQLPEIIIQLYSDLTQQRASSPPPSF